MDSNVVGGRCGNRLPVEKDVRYKTYNSSKVYLIAVHYIIAETLRPHSVSS